MPIRTILIRDQQNTTRKACVIAGQAYYQSSGESSNTPGVWYPFEGVDDETVTGGNPRFWFKKPYFDRYANENHHFPLAISMAMDMEADWKRHKSMECLYVSCLLSGDRFSPQLRNTLHNYINKDHLLFSLDQIIQLDDPEIDDPERFFHLSSDVTAINAWLTQQGANLDNEAQGNETFSESISQNLRQSLIEIHETLANQLVELPEQETLNTSVSISSNQGFLSWCSYFCCCKKQTTPQPELEEPLTNNPNNAIT